MGKELAPEDIYSEIDVSQVVIESESAAFKEHIEGAKVWIQEHVGKQITSIKDRV